MELTLSDVKRRKSLNNEKEKEHLSQEMPLHCIEISDQTCGPAAATVPSLLWVVSLRCFLTCYKGSLWKN